MKEIIDLGSRKNKEGIARRIWKKELLRKHKKRHFVRYELWRSHRVRCVKLSNMNVFVFWLVCFLIWVNKDGTITVNSTAYILPYLYLQLLQHFWWLNIYVRLTMSKYHFEKWFWTFTPFFIARWFLGYIQYFTLYLKRPKIKLKVLSCF